MKKNILFIILISFFGTLSGKAQNTFNKVYGSGTLSHNQKFEIAPNNPAVRDAHTPTPTSSGDEEATKKVRVRFVVIRNNALINAASNAEVNAALNNARAAFKPHRIHLDHIETVFKKRQDFYNASGSEIIAMKELFSENPETILNIFVIHKGTDNANDNDATKQYAKGTFPWDGDVFNPKAVGKQGGIVIAAKVLLDNNDESDVFIHEIGHCFGLYHTFHGNGTPHNSGPNQPEMTCANDPLDVENFLPSNQITQNDTRGDFCSDTYPMTDVDEDGNSLQTADCDGNLLANFSTLVPKNNYMSRNLSNRFEFTPQQAGRMHAFLEFYEIRGWLHDCEIYDMEYYNEIVKRSIQIQNNIIASNTFFPTNVIVPSGNNVTWQAGNKITLKPGFKAIEGCDFKAIIAPCTPMRLMTSNYSNDEENIYLEEKGLNSNLNVSDEQKITISPNPSNGIFTVQSGKEISKIEITNAIGEKVYSASVIGRLSSVIDLRSKSKGIYFIRVQSGTQIYTDKLIIQ